MRRCVEVERSDHLAINEQKSHITKLLQQATLDDRKQTKRRLMFVMKGQMLTRLECGPMPNVMAVLSNVSGALCSTPQSSADAHY